MSVFTGASGLRHGWRSVIGFGAVAASAFLALLVSQVALGEGRLKYVAVLVRGVLVAATALATSRILVRRIDRADLASIGLAKPWRAALADIGKGLGLGALLFSLAMAPLVLLGDAAIAVRRPFAGGIFLATLAFAPWAAFEEIALRGYALQHAVKGMGRLPATALFAILFALAHAGNPGFSAFAFVNVALAGVLLSALLFRSGSLFVSIGVHWAWNVTEGIVFGTSVSGTTGDGAADPSLFSTHLSGPSYLTGGAFGVEAGLTCGVVLAVASAVLFPRRDATRTPLASRPRRRRHAR
jgi:membrane protease YdiL (CAAX protease family)